jgi:hypothetical protein
LYPDVGGTRDANKVVKIVGDARCGTTINKDIEGVGVKDSSVVTGSGSSD